MSKNWMESIKVGDVVYRSTNYGRAAAKEVVTKITSTQIVCGLIRFKRDTGRMIGASGYDVSHLIEATPGLKKQVRASEVKSTVIQLSRQSDVGTDLWISIGETIDRWMSERDQPGKPEKEESRG